MSPVLGKPRLLFESHVERRTYWRRFRFSLIVLVVVLFTLLTLSLVRERMAGDIDSNVLDTGGVAGVVVAVLLFLRAVVNLGRWLVRRDEHIRIFDQGFTWSRSGVTHKYGWSRLRTLREGGHGLYLRKRSLVQWGVHRLRTADDETFTFKPVNGDMRRFIRVVRPLAAEVTGIHMARTLRQGKSVRLHRDLQVWPGGVAVKKRELPWASLDVKVRNRRLILRTLADNGRKNASRERYKVVRSYALSSVDNVGGFIELAATTIRNHR